VYQTLKIQGANADWVKLALVYMYQEIQKDNLPVKLRLTVHDEIVTSAPEDYAQIWKGKQEQHMINAGQTIIKSIPVVIESGVSKHWGH
jgi:DNA polymerase-1